MRHSARFMTFLAFATVSSPLRAQTSPQTGLTLSQVLDSVVRQHPSIGAAQARVRAAQGARSTAGRFGNPSLSYQIENIPSAHGSTVPMDREAMTMLMLPLEPVYQRGARVRRADAMTRSARADATTEERRVAMEAAAAFYRLALAQVRLEAAREVAQLLDSVVGYNRVRVREGVTAESDLIRTELERDRAMADAVMAEADLVQAREELGVFLGEQGQGVKVAADSLPWSFSTQGTLDSAGVLRVLAARPELQAAREHVIAARAGMGVERSMIFRQFGLTLGIKRTAGTSSLVLGASVPVPLFDRNGGEIARATAERDAATLELVAIEREARAQFSGLQAAARLLTDRINSQLDGRGPASYLARAAEVRRIALGAYQEGAIPLIQVIDAVRASADARTSFFELLYAQQQTVLRLVVARGDDPIVQLPSLRSTRSSR